MTVQAGHIAASGWMDNKLVTVMYTGFDPAKITTVQRRQRDGSKKSVTCPVATASYNKYMGGVDRGDQLRGYYSTKIKCRKFYKYIVNFLVGVALSNSFIVHRHCHPNQKLSLKHFHELVATQLIGNYCTRKKPGRITYPVRSLGLLHFPQKKIASATKRGRCVLCQEQHHRVDTSWYCGDCGVWLCHRGLPSDCFIKYHQRNS